MQAQNLTHTQNESCPSDNADVHVCMCESLSFWFRSNRTCQNLWTFFRQKRGKKNFQIDILPNWEKVRRKRTQKMHLCNDGYLSKTFEHMFPALICVKFYSFVVSFLLWNYVIAKKCMVLYIHIIILSMPFSLYLIYIVR